MLNWRKLFEQTAIPKSFLLALAAGGMSLGVSGQSTYLFIRNHPESSQADPKVELKWLSSEFFYEDGVNVFRRVKGRSVWEKINVEPIKSVDVSGDDDDRFFVDALTSNHDFQGEWALLGLNALVKLFEDNDLARKLGSYYVDTTAAWGREYDYKVIEAAAGGLEFYSLDPHRVNAYQRDHPIEEISVSVEKSRLGIDWHFEDNRYYAYEVEVSIPDSLASHLLTKRPVVPSRQKDSRGVLSLPSPLYRLSDLKDDTEYEFVIYGRDYFGNRTRPSTKIDVSTGDNTAPPAPKNLRGRNDTLKVRLRWKYEECPDLAGFNIYYSSSYEGEYKRLNPKPIFSDTFEYEFDDPGPAYFHVSSIDYNANEAKSRTIFVEIPDLLPPPLPTGLKTAEDSMGVFLTWDEKNTEDLEGYRIYRTSGPGLSNPLLLNAIPVSDNFFLDTLPKILQNRIWYRVVAIDTNYNQSLPSEWTSIKFRDQLPPETPIFNRIQSRKEGIQLTWKCVGDEDFDYYRIERYNYRKRPLYTKADTIFFTEECQYFDGSVLHDSIYHYKILAVDNSGNKSFPSEVLSGKAAAGESSEKAKLKLEARRRKRGKLVRLSWTKLSAAYRFVVFAGREKTKLLPVSGSISATDLTIENAYSYYQVRAFRASADPLTSQIVSME